METNEQKKVRIGKELKIIKETYGEDFSRFCRSKFQIILNYPGLLPQILLSHFAPNRFLLSDIRDGFNANEREKIFITSIKQAAIDIIGYDIFAHEIVDTGKSVKELLGEAGYDFYECTTDGENPESKSDIQYFRRYYRTIPDEVVCTIKNGGRLKMRHVFWIVKKDVDIIKPSQTPEREDDYSKSVLSIQFDRDTNEVEIISRYNHTVTSPNSTCDNDLEEIWPGLTKAFEKDYGLVAVKRKQPNHALKDMLDGYIKDNTGKYHKVNHYINGIAYCINNIIIDGEGNVIVLDKSRYILIDYFIFDKLERKIYPFDSQIKDPFLDAFINLSEIRIDENKKERKTRIIDELDRETGIRTIRIKQIGEKDIIIKIDERGRIISYDNKNLTSIEERFLEFNTTLKNINIPNGTKIDYTKQAYRFVKLLDNKYVSDKNGNLYKCNYRINGITYCSDNTIIDKEGNVIVLDTNRYILIDYFIFDKQEKKIYPYDNSIKDSFSDMLEGLNQEDINIIETIDEKTGIKLIIIRQQGKEDIIIKTNEYGQIISYENKMIKTIGDNFLNYNTQIENINLPNVEEIGNNFCNKKELLKRINLPSVKKIGEAFCEHCKNLSTINIQNVETIGDYFCNDCSLLTDLMIPNVRKVGKYFCYDCNQLTKVDLPEVKEIGDSFCKECEKMTSINIPNAETIGNDFCRHCSLLTDLMIPNVRKIGRNFCDDCSQLTKVDLPKVKEIGDSFCEHCPSLASISMKSIEVIGDDFCKEFKSLKNIELPSVKIIGEAFCEGCEKLTSINIPNVKKVGESFCKSCESLIKVELPNVEIIGDYFCYRCSSLTEINLQKSKNIGAYFCEYCQSLKKVELPNAETIERDFCYRCSSLRLVSAQKAKEIESSFCNDCESLTEINLPNVEEIKDKFLDISLFKSKRGNQALKIILPRLIKAGFYFLQGQPVSELYLPKAKTIGSIDEESLDRTLIKLCTPNLSNKSLKETLEKIAKNNNGAISRIINLKIYRVLEKFKLIKNKISAIVKKGEQNEEVRNNRHR